MISEHALRVLEFQKISEMLVERAVTAMGKELAARLRPFEGRAAIAAALAETGEAAAIVGSKFPPLGGISDVREDVRRCALGGVVQPEGLVRIGATAAGIGALRRFLAGCAGPGSEIWKAGGDLADLKRLDREIMERLTEDGGVKDDASPRLRKIRSQMRSLSAKIRDRLDAMTRSPETCRLLQEPIVTIRNGRFVIPVRQEMRSLVPGVVHDQSASGATLFIEPLQVLEMGNELRRLEAEEADEVEKIIRDLSALVGGYADELLRSLEAAGRVDFAFAKGRLSLDMDASEPVLADDWVVDLKRARHPLLKGEVVPVDIHLGRSYDTLVITGPNTGGKTVTLKTVGLLVLMAHAGLHIPAAPGSVVGPFRGVFCDVGDEQSIEQSLSTFSSHMGNIVAIIESAREGSLVLLDELGAGTDPVEGSSLAMAILEYLHSTGAKTVATTHYSELKWFAFTRNRIENASVEFDVETLRPTYRLTIGVPGRSNAFEIALRLGLPPGIVSSAKRFVGREGARMEEAIGEIERAKRAAEKDLADSEAALRSALDLRNEYERRLKEIGDKEREIERKARADAMEIVRTAKARARLAMERLKEAETAPRECRGSLIQAARDALREAASVARGDAVGGADFPPEVEGPAPGDLKSGERVFVRSLGRAGTVVESPAASKEVVVQVGVMRVQADLRDLVRVPATGPAADGEGQAPMGRAPGGGAVSVMRDKAGTISPEMDVRGMTVAEAVSAVEKYLDDAILAGAPQVRIIHGKGTGALRSAVRELLGRHPAVASSRLGVAGEGGDGVTVAVLK
ncbi:MAG: endonuclease MutS2 [Firmicutes bacterium]|nr:endonuclease MutS2 [Bacillota bacterium]